MIFGAQADHWHTWSIPSLPCEEVKGFLVQQFEEGLSHLEDLKDGLHDHFVHMVANISYGLMIGLAVGMASSSQVLKSWPWWTFLGPVAPQMSSIFNAQAALCASSRCCRSWPLGEMLLSWQRAQEKMNLLLWLGTFHGSMVLAPDTVEGRFLQGQWHGEVDYDYEMTIGERMVHQFWLEYRAAVEIFDLCLRALHMALTALRDSRWESASERGAFASSMVALYELANIRTVDEGLLRWLSQGLFRGKSVAEFGALNGASSAWLNSSGANIEAFAFDGVRDVAQLTQGRVEEKDLSLPLHLPRSYDWILSLEVAEHIPEAHLPHFLENIRRHCLEGAVISWSRCGTGGERHVSCRSPEEARALLAAYGLVADLNASATAQAASTVFWISRTVQVYRIATKTAEINPSPSTPGRVQAAENKCEINCALTLLCQMIGNIIAFIGATSMVMSTPYKDVAGIDEAQMNVFINDVIYSKIVTGMCCTMIFGNTYYAWMAYRMMRKEKTTNVCTLPYGVLALELRAAKGINTPAAFAFIFGVIAKASKEAAATGMSMEDGVLYAWRVGCVANLVSGFIATMCGFAGPLIVKVAPAASLMVALAGLGFTYLGIGQIIACFEVGHLGLLPLGVALISFFGDVKTSPLPAAVLVMAVGSLTGWLSFEGWPEGSAFPSGGTPEAVKESFSFYFPSVLGPDSFKVIPAVLMKNIAVILPVAFVGAVNTLVSVYAAHSAGDMYPIRECLIVDGLTTVVAALFGSPFGTCVYCGHPQFKQQGGKIYYSFLNCIGFCFLASTGLFAACNALIPPWGIAPIILFVGLAINQDAFNVVESRHIPAAIIGLFPQTADWILSVWPGGPESKPGLAAMSYGALVVCIIWTSMGIFLIDRRFVQAGIWALVASCLAGLGLIHQAEADLTFKTYSGSATQPFGRSPAAFQLGYMTLALLFGILRILQNCGCSRVPPERKEVDDNDAEKEAEVVAERCNERPQSRIFDAMMSNEIAAGYEEQEDSEAESTDDGDMRP